MNDHFLLKVADVLDAMAEEKSQLETQLNTIKEAKRREQLDPVVEKLSYLTGDNPEDLNAKLAGIDDSVLSMLSGLADTGSSSMGSPGHAKTASLEGNSNTVDRADRAFTSWILS